MKDYMDELRKIPPHEFKMQYLGQFYEPEEVTDQRNRPGQQLWDCFSRVCDKIEQPCARYRGQAEPGDWYLSLCHDKNWYIMEKTEDGNKQCFTLPGLRTRDMIETLMYADAIIFQYNSNTQGEDQ